MHIVMAIMCCLLISVIFATGLSAQLNAAIMKNENVANKMWRIVSKSNNDNNNNNGQNGSCLTWLATSWRRGAYGL